MRAGADRKGNEMILSTGRAVVESEMNNGATFAEIEGGLQMTDAEWEEYCEAVRQFSLQESRERLAARKPSAATVRMDHDRR